MTKLQNRRNVEDGTRVDNISIFHNSRRDVRTVVKYSGILKDKINELVDTVNLQETRTKELGKSLVEVKK